MYEWTVKVNDAKEYVKGEDYGRFLLMILLPRHGWWHNLNFSIVYAGIARNDYNIHGPLNGLKLGWL